MATQDLGGDLPAGRAGGPGRVPPPSAPVLASLEFRLTYADCDPAQIVYFAAYYPWMERTLAEFSASNELTASDIPRRFGVVTVARASGCEYLVASLPYERIRCDLSCEQIGASSYTYGCTFSNEGGVRVARGFMTVVCVDPETRRPVKIPDGLRAVLRPEA